MRGILFILVFLASRFVVAQPNCMVYKYSGDTLKCLACEKAEEMSNYYQFSREFQSILDEALAIDSTYYYAYKEKSVAYLKSGDFLTWKILIDKAVKYDPVECLGYRGWCRYQFFRDYKGAIKDFEQLDSLIDYDMGTCVNGDYHLQIARAICYKALGEKQKAIEIIETQLNEEDHFLGLYDYLHLGVLYLEIGNAEKAIQVFQMQQKENPLAENQFYMAKAYKMVGDQEEYLRRIDEALELYKKGRMMSDPYTHHYDKVYLSDIGLELIKAMTN
ncbi:MAG: hypothetical protein CL840_13730 [Crocinitomicaceae bacterium]|nr:hypothetical protein [Crocinitomicaceae bacterium]|tara:strand:+ start:2561 stop:3385 length:825 start_codon:yes stop_codon:yes gene_type:complete